MTPQEEREQRLQLHKVAIGGLALFLGFELFNEPEWLHHVATLDWDAEHSKSRFRIPWQVIFLTPLIWLFRGNKKVPEVVRIEVGPQLVDDSDRKGE